MKYSIKKIYNQWLKWLFMLLGKIKTAAGNTRNGGYLFDLNYTEQQLGIAGIRPVFVGGKGFGLVHRTPQSVHKGYNAFL